jgi:hypothetical protein
MRNSTVGSIHTFVQNRPLVIENRLFYPSGITRCAQCVSKEALDAAHADALQETTSWVASRETD